GHPEHPAIDRYDRWLPWGDRRRVRTDVEPHRGRAVSQHVLVQVLGTSEYARRATAGRRRIRRGEDAAHCGAAAVAARDSDDAPGGLCGSDIRGPGGLRQPETLLGAGGAHVWQYGCE